MIEPPPEDALVDRHRQRDNKREGDSRGPTYAGGRTVSRRNAAGNPAGLNVDCQRACWLRARQNTRSSPAAVAGSESTVWPTRMYSSTSQPVRDRMRRRPASEKIQ